MPYGIATHNGKAYVTGSTTSIDFPVANATLPANAGGADMFITELDPRLSGAASMAHSPMATTLNSSHSHDRLTPYATMPQMKPIALARRASAPRSTCSSDLCSISQTMTAPAPWELGARSLAVSSVELSTQAPPSFF